MKDTAKLALVLTLISACAALVLSMVESVTREPIAEQRRAEMMRALRSVLPEADNEFDTDTAVLEVGRDKKDRAVMRTFFRGRLEGNLSGVAFKVVAADGYSGNIEVMVGIKPEGTVQSIAILAHAETPGLGNKIEDKWFIDQFHNKGLSDADWRVKKDGGDFDQISGATISPRAIVGAVREGLIFYGENRDAILKLDVPNPQEVRK